MIVEYAYASRLPNQIHALGHVIYRHSHECHGNYESLHYCRIK